MWPHQRWMIALAKSRESLDDRKCNQCEERRSGARPVLRGTRCGVWRLYPAPFSGLQSAGQQRRRTGRNGRGPKRSGPNVSTDYAATHSGLNQRRCGDRWRGTVERMAVPPQSVVRVLLRARLCAGTARPHLSRISGAGKSVVAVTMSALRPESGHLGWPSGTSALCR